MIYRHKKSRQVIRAVPGSKEQQRLAASDSYTEVKPSPSSTPTAEAPAPTAERRDATTTGAAKMRTGGRPGEQ